jgi:hypothetical protein
VIGVFAVGYAVMLADNPAPYFRPPAMWDGSFKYAVPTSMMQNTIPQEEVPNARKLVQTARGLTENGGKIIVNRIFLSYAILEGVPKDRIIFTKTESSLNPENFAEELDGSEAYTIWWVPGEGWHGVKSLPEYLEVVETRGKLALYIYRPVNED